MVDVASVGLGWWARKMGALIKKSRETELLRAAEPNAAAKDAGDQFGFQSPRTWRRRWTIRRSTRSFSRPRTASMASMVRQSVAARKHVLCERPLASPARKGSLRSTSANRRASWSVWATNFALSLRLPANSLSDHRRPACPEYFAFGIDRSKRVVRTRRERSLGREL
jgi:predicted dehydrogenase